MKTFLFHIAFCISLSVFSQKRDKIKRVKNKDSVLIEIVWDTLIPAKDDTVTVRGKKIKAKDENLFEQWYQTAIPVRSRSGSIVGYTGMQWQRRYVKKKK